MTHRRRGISGRLPGDWSGPRKAPKVAEKRDQCAHSKSLMGMSAPKPGRGTRESHPFDITERPSEGVVFFT
jgi:hypothetical protein